MLREQIVYNLSMQENSGRFLHKATRQSVDFHHDTLFIDGRPIVRKGDKLNNSFRSSAVDLNQEVMLLRRLDNIASMLERGLISEAILLASLTDWPQPDTSFTAIHKWSYDQSEPRDRDGEWSRSSQEDEATKPVVDVQYRGYFHDVVVDDLLKGLEAAGSTVLKNIRVLGINGVLAIPDGASRPKGLTLPYFIEVKTGEDPPFTRNQQQVYPLICLGGHATSFDPRIRQLGLVPGVPFPPLRVLVVYTRGPGLPMNFIDGCKQIFTEGGAGAR